MKRLSLLLIALAFGFMVASCGDTTDDSDGPVTVEQLLISVDDLEAEMESGTELVLVDVRSQAAFSNGHIPGAISLPASEISDRIGDLDTQVRYVTYCAAGNGASGSVGVELAENGFPSVAVLDGGYPAWEAAQLNTEGVRSVD